MDNSYAALNALPLLPPLSDAEVSAGALAGEGWQEARARLEKKRYAVADAPCSMCGYPIYHYAHETPLAICYKCNTELLQELENFSDS